MIRKMKRSLFVTFGILLLVIIIILPVIYFQFMDVYIYEKQHKMEKISFELSSDVKDIKMVNRLHELLNSYYTQWNGENNVFLVNESKSEDLEILYGDDIIEELKGIAFVKHIYDGDYREFTYLSKFVSGNEVVESYHWASRKQSIEVKWDAQSEKVYGVKYQGEEASKITDKEIYEMEKEYIKYMNLTLVDDWNYNNKKMISKKAHLMLETIVNEKSNTIELGWKVIE